MYKEQRALNNSTSCGASSTKAWKTDPRVLKMAQVPSAHYASSNTSWKKEKAVLKQTPTNSSRNTIAPLAVGGTLAAVGAMLSVPMLAAIGTNVMSSAIYDHIKGEHTANKGTLELETQREGDEISTQPNMAYTITQMYTYEDNSNELAFLAGGLLLAATGIGAPALLSGMLLAGLSRPRRVTETIHYTPLFLHPELHHLPSCPALFSDEENSLDQQLDSFDYSTSGNQYWLNLHSMAHQPTINRYTSEKKLDVQKNSSCGI